MKKLGVSLIFLGFGCLQWGCTATIRLDSGNLIITGANPSGVAADPVSDILKLVGRCKPGDTISAKDDNLISSVPATCASDGSFTLSVVVDDKGGDGERKINLTQSSAVADVQSITVQQKYCDTSKSLSLNPSGEGTERNPWHFCNSSQLSFYSEENQRKQLKSDQYARLKVDVNLDVLPSTERRREVIYRGDPNYFSRAVFFDGESHRVTSRRGRPLFHRFYSGSIHDLSIDTTNTFMTGEDRASIDASCLVSEVNSSNAIDPTLHRAVLISGIKIRNCDLFKAYALANPVSGNYPDREQRGVGALVGYFRTLAGDGIDLTVKDIQIGRISLNADCEDAAECFDESIGALVGGVQIQSGGSMFLENIQPVDQNTEVQISATDLSFSRLPSIWAGGLVGSFSVLRDGLFPATEVNFSVKSVLAFRTDVISSGVTGGVLGLMNWRNGNGNSKIILSDVAQNPIFDKRIFGQYTGCVFGEALFQNGSDGAELPATSLLRMFSNCEYVAHKVTEGHFIGGVYGAAYGFGRFSMQESVIDARMHVGDDTNGGQTSMDNPVAGVGAFAGELINTIIASDLNTATKFVDSILVMRQLGTYISGSFTKIGLLVGNFAGSSENKGFIFDKAYVLFDAPDFPFQNQALGDGFNDEAATYMGNDDLRGLAVFGPSGPGPTAACSGCNLNSATNFEFLYPDSATGLLYHDQVSGFVANRANQLPMHGTQLNINSGPFASHWRLDSGGTIPNIKSNPFNLYQD